jgi:hypothetical protein
MSGCGDFYGDKFDVFEFPNLLFIVSSETSSRCCKSCGVYVYVALQSC